MARGSSYCDGASDCNNRCGTHSVIDTAKLHGEHAADQWELMLKLRNAERQVALLQRDIKMLNTAIELRKAKYLGELCH